MHLTSFLDEGQLTIALTGEIDHHCAKEYISQIRNKLETYMPKLCVLDFGAVTFMDSSGIAVVINTLRGMNQLNGQLLVAQLPPQPKKVFYAAGMDKLVQMKEQIT